MPRFPAFNPSLWHHGLARPIILACHPGRGTLTGDPKGRPWTHERCSGVSETIRPRAELTASIAGSESIPAVARTAAAIRQQPTP
jgi:hypothetical protein